MTLGRPKKYKTKMHRKPQLLSSSEVQVLQILAQENKIAEQRVLGLLIEKYTKALSRRAQKMPDNQVLAKWKNISTKIGLELSDQ